MVNYTIFTTNYIQKNKIDFVYYEIKSKLYIKDQKNTMS